MRTIFCLLALVLLSSIVHAAVEERQELKWEFPAQGTTGFIIKAVVGTVSIATDRKSGISVRAVRIVRAKDKNTAQLTLKETPVKYRTDGDRLTFEDVIPEHLRQERFIEDAPEVELEFEVHVPPGTKISSTLAVGETRISGEFDSLTVKSGYGLVRLENLKVKNGSLLTLDTGDLEIAGAVNDLQANLRVGSVRATLETPTANRVALQTQVGSIISQFKSLPKLDLAISAGVGNVQLKIPSNTKGDATVSVQTGKLRSDFNLTRRPRVVGDTGGLLTGSMGKGNGITLKLTTGVGDAVLEKG